MLNRDNSLIESRSLSATRDRSTTGPPVQSSREKPAAGRSAPGGPVAIGGSLVLTGTLTGQEDVYIDGTLEGTIELRDSDLTIGPNGNINADIKARKVTVLGRVSGKIFPTESIEVLKSASLKGTVRTPRIAVEEGAVVQGRIEALGQELESPTARQSKPLIVRQGSRSES